MRYVGPAGRGGRGRETRALAEDAAERVEVDYEPLRRRSSTRARATQLVRWEQRAGDVAGAFASAAHVVRTEHVIPRLAATPMEPRGALAAPDGERLTVWSSSQSAHRPRAQLAQMLGLAEAAHPRDRPRRRRRLRLQGDAAGRDAAGRARRARSSGARSSGPRTGARTSLAAPQGRGLRAAVELALDADGRILGLRGRLLADLGAYLLPSTAIPPHTTAMLLTGCYDIQDVEVVVTGARTNKVPTAPYRGAGRPEATLPDRDGDRRRRARAGDRPGRAAPPQPRALVPVQDRARLDVRLGRLRALPGHARSSCSSRSAEAPARSDGRWSAPPTTRRCRPLDASIGTGVALCVERSGGLYEHATVARDGDDVLVAVGSTPTGQGHETLFAQIAADRLGIDPERVTVRTGDTDAIADGRRLLRQPHDGDGRLGRRRRGRRPARPAGPGAARFASDQVFASGAYVAGGRGRARDRAGARAAAGRRRRRGPDRQPAARRGPGDRRRRAGPRRRA